MPYIEQSRRDELDQAWEPTHNRQFKPQTAGELNYRITTVIQSYLGPEPHYEDLNAVIGVLEAAKLELYRRVVAPYEDWKANENGDVYA